MSAFDFEFDNESIMEDFPDGKRKGKSWDGIGEPKKYKQGHVYIFDAPSPEDQAPTVMRRQRPDSHRFNCDLIQDFFNDYTSYAVHNVRFPQGSNKNDVYAFWENVLATKTKEDLIIGYFHGRAGKTDKDYSWRFSHSYPRTDINAHRIIGMANKSESDCLFLLDCWLQSRATKKWKPTREGVTEIIARPEGLNDTDGKVHESSQDFTIAIVQYLESFIEHTIASQKACGPHRSIPQILRSRKQMYSNPQRMWLDRCRYGDQTPIYRLKVKPQTIKETGKWEFVGVPMQLPDPEEAVQDYVEETYESEVESDVEEK